MRHLSDRREFLKKTGATIVFLGAAGCARVRPRPRRISPNEKINVAFIGLGGRARWLMEHEKPALAAARIVAVSDAFLPRAKEIAKYHPDGKTWTAYHDYREMFDKEKLDAVFVETTCHARVLVCIHALQAGLDVYGEKPLTLTVREGRVLERAVRKSKRILQTGTQQRAIPINRYASKLVRDGALGRIREVIACNFLGPQQWTPKPAQPMPEGLNWDLWCNQTELRPYHRDLQYRWALWWDYDGGGQSWGVTGWGTHALDQVQCALGTDDTGPVEIRPEGAGPECKITMRYGNGTLLKLHGEPRKETHEDLGAIFVGEKGRIEILRGDFRAEPKELEAQLRKDAPEPTPEGPNECAEHLGNFFDCIRTRKKPLADVEIGHRSTTLCHLVNICRELGRELRWNPKAEKFIGDNEANRKLSRPRRKGYELPKIG